MTTIRYGARPTEKRRNREVEATAAEIWSKTLMCHFRTDPEVIAAVLPEPLKVSDDPLVRVSIAQVNMGGGREPFGAGTFAVSCRHGDMLGSYPLVMPMTTEQAVVGGRETYGEPKKLSQMGLERDGDSVRGWAARLGTEFIELHGTVVEELDPPEDDVRYDFYFKFLPSPDGDGLDHDAALVHCKRVEKTRKIERIRGEVILRDSQFDPVADFPVLDVVDMYLAERAVVQTGEIVDRVPAENVLPFVHQRYDDLSPTGSD